MIRLSHIPRFSSKFLLGDIIATKCLLRHPRWKEMVAVCLLDSKHPIIPDGKLMQILSIQSNDTKNAPLQKVAGSHFPWIFHDSRCTTRGNMWKWHAMKRKKPGMACLPEPRLPHMISGSLTLYDRSCFIQLPTSKLVESTRHSQESTKSDFEKPPCFSPPFFFSQVVE